MMTRDTIITELKRIESILNLPFRRIHHSTLSNRQELLKNLENIKDQLLKDEKKSVPQERIADNIEEKSSKNLLIKIQQLSHHIDETIHQLKKNRNWAISCKKDQKQITTMQSPDRKLHVDKKGIPNDILSTIFTEYFPMQARTQLRSVCKNWDHLIGTIKVDTYFVEAHKDDFVFLVNNLSLFPEMKTIFDEKKRLPNEDMKNFPTMEQFNLEVNFKLNQFILSDRENLQKIDQEKKYSDARRIVDPKNIFLPDIADIINKKTLVCLGLPLFGGCLSLAMTNDNEKEFHISHPGNITGIILLGGVTICVILYLLIRCYKHSLFNKMVKGQAQEFNERVALLEQEAKHHEIALANNPRQREEKGIDDIREVSISIIPESENQNRMKNIFFAAISQRVGLLPPPSSMLSEHHPQPPPPDLPSAGISPNRV